MCAAFALGVLHNFQIWYGSSWGSKGKGTRGICPSPLRLPPSGAVRGQSWRLSRSLLSVITQNRELQVLYVSCYDVIILCCLQKYQYFAGEMYISMSADATCRGLRSPSDGPLTMELRKGTRGLPYRRTWTLSHHLAHYTSWQAQQSISRTHTNCLLRWYWNISLHRAAKTSRIIITYVV